MSEIIVWAQTNWYEVGILLIAAAFLITGVWFARNMLRTVRAFQEQIGALLKLSITSGPTEVSTGTARAKSSLAEASPYWLTPSETPIALPAEAVESGPGRFVVAWRRWIAWLEMPMSSSEPGRMQRVMHWLQEPASH